MVQMIEANWLIFLAALVIGLVVAYWIFAHGSKTAGTRTHRPDVLDEGAAPAQRNQALIDSASPAAQYDLPVPEAAAPAPAPVHIDPPAAAGTMAGIGEVIAVAAQEEAQRAEAASAVQDEAQATAPEPASTPASPPASTPETAGKSAAPADDLRKIKGLGPKMQKLLVSLEVTRYAQIAAWSEADLDDLDTKLGAFAGRPRRDKWVEQARLLATGDTGAYEAEFGKI